jgi:ferredoxin-thioredoxin reductase catalytic subunit
MEIFLTGKYSWAFIVSKQYTYCFSPCTAASASIIYKLRCYVMVFLSDTLIPTMDISLDRPVDLFGYASLY